MQFSTQVHLGCSDKMKRKIIRIVRLSLDSFKLIIWFNLSGLFLNLDFQRIVINIGLLVHLVKPYYCDICTTIMVGQNTILIKMDRLQTYSPCFQTVSGSFALQTCTCLQCPFAQSLFAIIIVRLILCSLPIPFAFLYILVLC